MWRYLRVPNWVSQSKKISIREREAGFDFFVFNFRGALSTAASSRVTLQGGVTAATVYWQVDAAFGSGASSTFYGIVLATGTFTLGASAVFVGKFSY